MVFLIASSTSIPAFTACFTIEAITFTISIPFLFNPSTSSTFIFIPNMLSIPLIALKISSIFASAIFFLDSFRLGVFSFETSFLPSPISDYLCISLGTFNPALSIILTTLFAVISPFFIEYS